VTEIPGPNHRQHRPENFLRGDARLGVNVGDDRRVGSSRRRLADGFELADWLVQELMRLVNLTRVTFVFLPALESLREGFFLLAGEEALEVFGAFLHRLLPLGCPGCGR